MSCKYLFLGLLLLAVTGIVDAGAAGQGTLPAVDPALYAMEPAPLQPAECGRCHPGPFGSLKAEGGKHRFPCQGCHEQFHAYDPRKGNYDDLMPKCASCHELPHGPVVTDCLACHSNPHAPRRIPVVERLTRACADCHAGPDEDLKVAPSKHSGVGCQGCHAGQHGYVPDCFECHTGHYPEQTVVTCADCHRQVHRPLDVPLTAETDARTCGVCHESAFGKWQRTPSRHGQVNCGSCHARHGDIPDCRSCHAQPHDPNQLARFPNCLTCHLDVHDLPVKR
ncbi:MAG: cytochrome c3 family protein [Desulfuromonadales bacterium]|nr:cytochrome c3 family protein [Desulfuromonadales bacterium]